MTEEDPHDQDKKYSIFLKVYKMVANKNFLRFDNITALKLADAFIRKMNNDTRIAVSAMMGNHLTFCSSKLSARIGQYEFKPLNIKSAKISLLGILL